MTEKEIIKEIEIQNRIGKQSIEGMKAIYEFFGIYGGKHD